MKKINWTRIALYVVGVVIVFRVLSSIYMSGFFHPKEVFVNDIKLTAPKRSYLVSVYSSNNKYHFDALSPLKLNVGSKYFIEDNQSIEITFADIGECNDIKLKDISVMRTSEVSFNKILSQWEKDRDYTVSLFRNEYGQCSNIYQLIKTQEEYPFFHLLLYHKEKKMEFSFIITDEADINVSLDEICDKRNENRLE